VTEEVGIQAIFNALGLPPEARVGARVPKKLLFEQGAPTPADKRVIQEGIEELHWLAVCKPATIGVPAFVDDAREYLEIAVVACAFRPGAKAPRLIELIHRAIPYPVMLVTSDDDGVSLSVAHKRHAENEVGKVVIERVVLTGGLPTKLEAPEHLRFLEALSLVQQPRLNLCTLYDGWLTRIEALNAARLNGTFLATDDAASIVRRRNALEAHSQLTREIIGLRAKATREKQLNRRVDLNLEIQRREAELEIHKKNL
jgi:hypothetical protein